MRMTWIALLAALAAAGCATKEEAAAPVQYTVLEADAEIPFAAHRVRNFRVGAEDTLLIEAGSRWYRATLGPGCRGGLRWQQAIGFEAKPADRIDKFSTVIVDGRRCAIETLDEIADPDAPAVPAAPPGS